MWFIVTRANTVDHYKDSGLHDHFNICLKTYLIIGLILKHIIRSVSNNNSVWLERNILSMKLRHCRSCTLRFWRWRRRRRHRRSVLISRQSAASQPANETHRALSYSHFFIFSAYLQNTLLNIYNREDLKIILQNI